ncbi:MAG: DUF6088 family protein [Bacteroidales bacterium]|jgi:hypothetical protein|nr:DUF6088 family protein [Bacteroidales bacterium]
MMKTSEYIKVTIAKLPMGYVFTYNDFTSEVNNKEAVIKSLNRMVASGKIAKLSKGKFYKAEKTPFGALEPEEKQVVKDLLEKDSKTIGYITGIGIYNQLKLTTQLSNTIEIVRNIVRPPLNRGMYTVKFIKQNNTITKDTIVLLQILDAIRFVKKIPDTDTDASCRRLKYLLQELGAEKQQNLMRLALKYSPATRALLGALLEDIKTDVSLDNLYKSLNPITKYKFSFSDTVLPTAPNCNIL